MPRATHRREGAWVGAHLDWKRPGLAPWQQHIASAALEAILADEDEEGRLTPGNPEAVARRGWLDAALGAGSGDLRRGFVAISLLLEWLPSSSSSRRAG